jgi:hypothetical protein
MYAGIAHSHMYNVCSAEHFCPEWKADPKAGRRQAMVKKKVVVEIKGGSSLIVDAKVQRGPESWTYIYVTLGFAISIEGTVVAMTPLIFPWNVIVYVIIALLTGWLWIENGWFQEKLIGLKTRYESKPR